MILISVFKVKVIVNAMKNIIPLNFTDVKAYSIYIIDTQNSSVLPASDLFWYSDNSSMSNQIMGITWNGK